LAATSVTAAQIISGHTSGATGQYCSYVLIWLIPILLVLAAYTYTDTVAAPDGRRADPVATRSGEHAT
jgi:hypothetical protein